MIGLILALIIVAFTMLYAGVTGTSVRSQFSQAFKKS